MNVQGFHNVTFDFEEDMEAFSEMREWLVSTINDDDFDWRRFSSIITVFFRHSEDAVMCKVKYGEFLLCGVSNSQ